jgi:hypothetical protein
MKRKNNETESPARITDDPCSIFRALIGADQTQAQLE